MLAKTTTHRQRYWLNHIKAADLSDGSIAEYAAANDVSLKGLYQWKTKLVKLKIYDPSASSIKSEFVPVKPSSSQESSKVDNSAQTNRSSCTVTLANGTCIEFHGELSTGVIKSIMTAVSHAH